MINWHRVAHWFGLNSWFTEIIVHEDSITSQQHCTKCDETKNTLTLFPFSPVRGVNLREIFVANAIANGWKE